MLVIRPTYVYITEYNPTICNIQPLNNAAHGLRNDIRWWHHLQQILLFGIIKISPLPEIALLSIRGAYSGQTQRLGETLDRFRSDARLGGVQY